MIDLDAEALTFAKAWYGLERGAEAFRLSQEVAKLLKRVVDETMADAQTTSNGAHALSDTPFTAA